MTEPTETEDPTVPCPFCGKMPDTTTVWHIQGRIAFCYTEGCPLQNHWILLDQWQTRADIGTKGTDDD